jgi:peroxiredoxin
LEAVYDPFFRDIFVEQKLYMYQLFSPFRVKKNPVYNNQATTEEGEVFVQSDTFHQDFKELVSLVKHLDPESYLYEGRFVYNVLLQVPPYVRHWPELEDQYDITVQECLSILDDFANNARNPRTRESVLYSLQSRYAQIDSTALSQKYRQKLCDDFPDGYYAKALEREKERSSWDKVSPYPAPVFSVTTLNGESISLEGYRGKFVFIDFWGSWCAPCRREIPHIMDMVNYLPQDKLEIIGLANDEEAALRTYIKKHELTYANALADKELLAAYDIKSYPSNFLIDPDGNVIGKNFRGGALIVDVAGEIEKWEEERANKIE